MLHGQLHSILFYLHPNLVHQNQTDLMTAAVLDFKLLKS